MTMEKKWVPRRGDRVKVREQSPEERIHNFNEVCYGYNEEEAVLEAQRCLQCPVPTCVVGCPASVDIPAFIRLIAEKKFLEAAEKIRERNSLPSVSGRVCPQESQCEVLCVLNRMGKPINIGKLEAFAADYALKHQKITPRKVENPKGRVAVVGSGPAGLTVAGDLVRMGYAVKIFEAFHAPGGVLLYGIPEFRLPKSVLKKEIDWLLSLGIELETNAIVGKLYSIKELFEMGFDAVFIGTGAGSPRFPGIPGENANGVYSASEYLTRVNFMRAFEFPRYDTPVKKKSKVVVVGGGNVAMDAARTARRLGADVTVVYRRTRAEMPARVEEVHHAEEEGIKFHFLVNPVRIIPDEKNWVKEIELIKMELGDYDSSGRRRPVPIEGSEFRMEAEIVIFALGQVPTPVLAKDTPGLETNPNGTIKTDYYTGSTSLEGVFAGGDVSTGAATVISAIGAGKRAALAIDKYIRSKKG